MKWDLSDLYRSTKDPRVIKDLTQQLKRADSFSKKYRNKVKKFDITGLKKALTEYENIQQEASKPASFAHLLFSANTREYEHGALMQKTETALIKLGNQLRFFELELIKIPEKRYNLFLKAKELRSWKHFLQKVVLFRKYRLSEREENIIEEKGATGARAWSRFFTQEHSNKKYPLKGFKNGAGESEVLKMLYDADRKKRISAHQAFTAGLKEELPRSSFIFNTKLQDKYINDQLLGYSFPESSRHLDNEISQKAVDALNLCVGKAFPIVHRYYQLKRKLLKIKSLHDYDRYAPLFPAKHIFSFSDAQKIVLDSFRKFSPEFCSVAKLFFDNRWIDVESRLGKSSGAFCAPVTPDTHPYILLNFHGTARDVMTLAHELGHGVHMYLSRVNGYLTYQGPLTLAETSSVMGELLVFDALMKKIKNPKEKLAFLSAKIEDVFSTVFRQIAMFRFERKIHEMFRSRGELSANDFNRFWRETQKEMFGSSLQLTRDYDLWWGYVSHFIHTPFYVYAYAFGQLLVFSLWGKYQKEGEAFIPKLIDLLRAGDSLAPRELLGRININIESDKFWNEGLKVIKDLVKEVQVLSHSL